MDCLFIEDLNFCTHCYENQEVLLRIRGCGPSGSVSGSLSGATGKVVVVRFGPGGATLGAGVGAAVGGATAGAVSPNGKTFTATGTAVLVNTKP